MLINRIKRLTEKGLLTLRVKLTLALSAIAVILLISSIITIMEYSSMSTYVSGLIADNVRNINVAQSMAEASNTYNLDILAVIGDDKLNRLPDFDREQFVANCDDLRKTLTGMSLQPLADSVLYSYSAYMLTSLELPDVLLSDFIDSRTWYFDRLQPKFNRLRADIDKMSSAMYNDLKANSATFDRGFYRSIIPGLVAVGVGLLLILMLLFFMLVYYVNPLYKMLSGLQNYRSYNKKYNYTFEGDDQLAELNNGIMDLTNENQQLRMRISALKNKNLQ